MLKPRPREHRDKPARCDCGTRFVSEHPEFVLEAVRRLRQLGADGPYTTLWHAPDEHGDNTDD
ncbi:hypothetical protein IU449_27060 [Nocardia higoensis]|uniref:Uncharacterized protein n=1 Tax=Nocardia higoensis TaxID=228599 RepID=A0ABS0DI68_9NOCA|nr:hypothetical protein [Nocardia higoensis]MBF6358161.1 hypothetical protein [Nocardia higoensis]